MNDETSVSELNGCDSLAKLSDKEKLYRSCQNSSLGNKYEWRFIMTDRPVPRLLKRGGGEL